MVETCIRSAEALSIVDPIKATRVEWGSKL